MQRCRAEAVNKPELVTSDFEHGGFGPHVPEIMLIQDEWSEDTQEWLPGDIIGRTYWPHDKDDNPDHPTWIIEQFGWQVASDHKWESTDYGFTTIVEPTPYD
jgi:hypothetical protein